MIRSHEQGNMADGLLVATASVAVVVCQCPS